MEARVGIEPTHKGFADLSLTTWVPRPDTGVLRQFRDYSSLSTGRANGRQVVQIALWCQDKLARAESPGRGLVCGINSLALIIAGARPALT